MLDRNELSKVAAAIVNLDPQMARALIRQAARGVRGKSVTPANVRLYLLALEVEQALAASAPARPAKGRRKPKPRGTVAE